MVGRPARKAPEASAAREPSLRRVIMEAEATLGVMRVVSSRREGVSPSPGAYARV